jgi:hypothetical protein
MRGHVDAQREDIHQYENIKEKLYKTNASIWKKVTCRLPKYILEKPLKQLQPPHLMDKFYNTTNEF